MVDGTPDDRMHVMLHDAERVENCTIVSAVVGQKRRHVIAHFRTLEATGVAKTRRRCEDHVVLLNPVRPLMTRLGHLQVYDAPAPHTKACGEKVLYLLTRRRVRRLHLEPTRAFRQSG